MAILCGGEQQEPTTRTKKKTCQEFGIDQREKKIQIMASLRGISEASLPRFITNEYATRFFYADARSPGFEGFKDTRA